MASLQARESKTLPDSPHITLPPPPGAQPAREKTCWQCGEVFVTALDHCPNDGGRLVDLALDEDHDPLINATIDKRYRVRERLGEGGMGRVYSAWDPEQRREVAIKVLKADYLRDENIRRRFMHEARIISNLEHPNAVGLYDFGQMLNGNFYMAMELLRGESLADRLARTFLSYGELFAIIEPVCEVLAEAHQNGIVHRDLKPENIFIVKREDGSESARLIDFGVSKNLARQTLTQTGTLWGTPAYMSPEQARGDNVGAGADIYAMGIILFELVCGHLPFTAETQMGYAVKHMHNAPRAMLSIPGLKSPPPSLDALVMRTLSKHAEQRPETMEVFVEELRAIIAADFEEEMMSWVPAQEIDPQGLQEWVSMDSEPGKPRGERPLVPTQDELPMAPGSAFETMGVQREQAPQGTPRAVVGAIVVLALLFVGLGIAVIASSDPTPAREATPVATERDAPQATLHAPSPAVAAVTALQEEGSREESGSAAGQGASRAAAMVIRAQMMTQEVSAAKEKRSTKGSAPRVKKPRTARKPPQEKSVKKERLEDALKGTF